MTDTIKKQILVIRDTGATNMFDAKAVQQLATMAGFDELAEFLEEHRSEYANFILCGR